MIQRPLGHQLVAELYGCDTVLIDDLDAITRLMLEAADACGATVVGHKLHRFSPQGVSGVVIIAESHLAIHTWPEHGYVAVDIFTCGETVQPRLAVDHLREAFRAASLKVTEIPRGMLAPPPPPRAPASELFHYGTGFVERYVAPGVRSPRREDARSLVTEIGEQVYLFPLFTPEFCSRLLEEAERQPGWLTVLEPTEARHSAPQAGFADVIDVIEPDTTLSFEEMPGACELYAEVIRHHVAPILEGLWTTFRLQKWDVPAVRRYEPHVVSRMRLHYDAETVGMVGYLNAGFTGGGTHFPRWGLTVGDSEHVQPGTVIVYPGGVSHEHLAHAVTAGRRYTLANSFY